MADCDTWVIKGRLEECAGQWVKIKYQKGDGSLGSFDYALERVIEDNKGWDKNVVNVLVIVNGTIPSKVHIIDSEIQGNVLYDHGSRLTINTALGGNPIDYFRNELVYQNKPNSFSDIELTDSVVILYRLCDGGIIVEIEDKNKQSNIMHGKLSSIIEGNDTIYIQGSQQEYSSPYKIEFENVDYLNRIIVTEFLNASENFSGELQTMYARPFKIKYQDCYTLAVGILEHVMRFELTSQCDMSMVAVDKHLESAATKHVSRMKQKGSNMTSFYNSMKESVGYSLIKLLPEDPFRTGNYQKIADIFKIVLKIYEISNFTEKHRVIRPRKIQQLQYPMLHFLVVDGTVYNAYHSDHMTLDSYTLEAFAKPDTSGEHLPTLDYCDYPFYLIIDDPLLLSRQQEIDSRPSYSRFSVAAVHCGSPLPKELFRSNPNLPSNPYFILGLALAESLNRTEDPRYLSFFSELVAKSPSSGSLMEINGLFRSPFTNIRELYQQLADSSWLEEAFGVLLNDIDFSSVSGFQAACERLGIHMNLFYVETSKGINFNVFLGPRAAGHPGTLTVSILSYDGILAIVYDEDLMKTDGFELNGGDVTSDFCKKRARELDTLQPQEKTLLEIIHSMVEQLKMLDNTLKLPLNSWKSPLVDFRKAQEKLASLENTVLSRDTVKINNKLSTLQFIPNLDELQKPPEVPAPPQGPPSQKPSAQRPLQPARPSSPTAKLPPQQSVHSHTVTQCPVCTRAKGIFSICQHCPLYCIPCALLITKEGSCPFCTNPLDPETIRKFSEVMNLSCSLCHNLHRTADLYTFNCACIYCVNCSKQVINHVYSNAPNVTCFCQTAITLQKVEEITKLIKSLS